jgi:cyclophilin family peptidyl-prolyl cis-trans isomerase
MNKTYIMFGGVVILLGAGYFFFLQDRGVEQEPSSFSASVQESVDNNTVTPPTDKTMQATIQTNYGEVVLEFFSDDAPKTVENFTKLAKEGFYDGTKFHRVISGFMIQGGDPFSKDNSLKDRWGTGGPGYAFEDEIHANNRNNTGTISMANAGPNTNGSQFFINVADNNFLDTKHTVFGRVKSGMDVVQTIENVATEGPDRPVEDAIIENITIAEN